MNNIFHKDPYAREIQTKIKTSFFEDDNHYVQVYENIFHPHGGGQKGDRGILVIGNQKIKVINAVKDKYSKDIVSLVTQEEVPEEMKDTIVICKLDWDFRYKQMKLHSAVHLHHCMIERALGRKVTPPRISDIQDGFAFNKYDKNEEIGMEIVEIANQYLKEAIDNNAYIQTYPDPQRNDFRIWECLGYKIPCGGTHPGNTSEIGDINITYSKKKGKPTVNIQLM